MYGVPQPITSYLHVSKQCFGSGSRGVLDPDPDSKSGYRSLKMVTVTATTVTGTTTTVTVTTTTVTVTTTTVTTTTVTTVTDYG